MVEIPFYAYLLLDSDTLDDYTVCHKVSVNEICRRLINSARSFNPYLPDYVYQNRYDAQDAEVLNTTSLGFFIKRTFSALAHDYLCMVNGRLYVKKEKLEEWMELMKVCPPLLVCSAYFLDDFQCRKSTADFFHDVLIPQFNTSAMRLPYVFELNNLVKHGTLLSDLHVHLNGSTETDVLWWSQIGNVDAWINSLRQSMSKDTVRSQYEQLRIHSLDKLSTHLRMAKKDINLLADKVNLLYPFFNREWQYYNPYNRYPVLAKAAYFYISLLDMMSRGDDRIAFFFHRMILVLGEVHQLIVQQRNQKGFTEFGVIPDNDLRWKHEDSGYISRFKQLMINQDFCFLEHLEGRFSPRDSVLNNIELIGSIINDYNSFKNAFGDTCKNQNKLTLIAHFIKQKDDEIKSMFERHLRLRRSISRKCHALLGTLDFIKTQNVCLRGIDAASNEMTAGPEVFAPAFRFMRNHWPDTQNLKITFHAGEDFVHLLSGLRMMVETEIFLDLGQGDRIGHGTAAGINPKLWMDRVGERVYISKGEWMDDMLVVYLIITNDMNPYGALKSILPILRNEIEERAMYIYKKPVSISMLTNSWHCRKFEPGYYLMNRQTCERDLREDECMCRNLLSNSEVKELYYKYHFDLTTKKRYSELEPVQINNGLFSVENLVQIQNLVLDRLARKNIALEVPISSNLSISYYRDLEEHHLERWLKGHSEDGMLLVPAVVIGSDDPGIFMTNIYIEYARIMDYLEKKGYNITERLQKVKELIELSSYYKF